jgi:predicted PurR-regulated permease PerM
MDSDKFKLKIIKIATIFTILVVLILGFDKVKFILSTMLSAFAPFIIGGILALVLNIPVRFIESKLFKNSGTIINKIKRPLSIGISLLLLIALISGIGLLVIPEIAEAVSNMSSSIPKAVQEGIVFLEQNIDLKENWSIELQKVKQATSSWENLVNYAIDFLPNISSHLTNAVSAAKSIVGSITNLLVSFIFCIYVITEKEKIINFTKKFLKTFTKDKYDSIMHFIITLHTCFEDFIYGQCLECFLVATIFTIAAGIMKFECAIIVGIIMFFLAFIPYVGNMMSCCIGMLLTLAMETPSRAIIICLLFCAIQALDGYFLYPRVIGLKVKMPPLLIFISAIAGGNLFGVVGMFLSIPIVTTIYILITEKMDGKKINHISCSTITPTNTNHKHFNQTKKKKRR